MRRIFSAIIQILNGAEKTGCKRWNSLKKDQHRYAYARKNQSIPSKGDLIVLQAFFLRPAC